MSEIANPDILSLSQLRHRTGKATIILAANQFCRRVQCRRLPALQACYEVLKPLLAPQTQLQYILLLISASRELLAFAENGSVLPDINYLTDLAIQAGAARILLARNDWPASSNTESCYLQQLQTTCTALHLRCDGPMAIGPERFKII